jgi:hypothetical protein
MTKTQAIKKLVALGCTIVDECKGKPTVKVITPSNPEHVAVVDPRDAVAELQRD